MKKVNSTFANHSFCNMDRQPINYYPKLIHMTNGSKHFFVKLEQNNSKFDCCNDYHPMSEDEFLFFIEEMEKYLRDKYNERLPKDHFLFTKLPQRLNDDYKSQHLKDLKFRKFYSRYHLFSVPTSQDSAPCLEVDVQLKYFRERNPAG